MALLLPIAASVLVTAIVSRSLPRPSGPFDVAMWWLGISGVGTVVLLTVDRLARRLLPLATLFKLSLAFPDEAPSRYRIALRTGTTRQLERRITSLRRDGLSADEMRNAETLLELVAALGVHDRLTRGHSERVRAYSEMVGEAMGLRKDEAERLRWAGLLHDVGKLLVPSEILNKPGKLTDDEYEAVKLHAEEGARLCEPLRPWLGDFVDAVGQHHERWDGNGYPNGLAGEQISLAGRIVAVADTYDVMTSHRSYKVPSSAAEARAELARCAGSQFDPAVVRAFLNISLGKLRPLAGPLAWLSHVPIFKQLTVGAAVGQGVTGTVAAAAAVTGGLIAAPVIHPEPAQQVELVVGAPDDEPRTFEPARLPRSTSSLDAPHVIPTALEGASRDPESPGEDPPPAGPGPEDPTTTVTLRPTTVPSTTVPSTTVPSTTVPSTTVPSTTVPSTTVPSTSTTTTTVAPRPPVAVDDFTVGSFHNHTDVLENDVDPDGNIDPLSVTIVQPPLHAKMAFFSFDEVNGFARLHYHAEKGYLGNDQLTYQVCDTTGLCATATVYLTIV